MDNRDYFLSVVLPLEGGRSNHPNDRGGLTNMGVTWDLLKSVRHDTNKDNKVSVDDLFELKYSDIKDILIKGGYYKTEYNNYHPELAFFLTDWAWGSGTAYRNGYIDKLHQGLKSYFSTFEVLTILNLVRSAFYRQIIYWRAKNAVFKSGWYKKMIQSAIRHNLGLNVNSDVILKHFPYDKTSVQQFNF